MHSAFVLANTEEYTFPALGLDDTLPLESAITAMTIAMAVALTIAIPAKRRG